MQMCLQGNGVVAAMAGAGAGDGEVVACLITVARTDAGSASSLSPGLLWSCGAVVWLQVAVVVQC